MLIFFKDKYMYTYNEINKEIEVKDDFGNAKLPDRTKFVNVGYPETTADYTEWLDKDTEVLSEQEENELRELAKKLEKREDPFLLG